MLSGVRVEQRCEVYSIDELGKLPVSSRRRPRSVVRGSASAGSEPITTSFMSA
jgi:hypothetical protein